MAEKIKSNKYKIGQKVWYIGEGYVSCDVIKGVFTDRHDEIIYTISSAKYEGDEYRIFGDNTFLEECIYPTKKALIKFIENQEE